MVSWMANSSRLMRRLETLVSRTRPSRTSSLSDTDLGINHRIRCPSMPQAPAGKHLESKVASLLASLAAIMSNNFLKVAAGPAERISTLSRLLACYGYRNCQQPGSHFSAGPRSPWYWLRGGFHPNPGGWAPKCVSPQSVSSAICLPHYNAGSLRYSIYVLKIIGL